MNKEDQLKLNQFISKAWATGLWHSESSFFQSIKGFIDELEKAQKQYLLEKCMTAMDKRDKAQKQEIRENGLKEMVKHKIITSKRAKELKKLIK